MRPPFAYVFERFPSFTQTFCVREVEELRRQGVEPMVFSIHDTADESIRQFPAALRDSVITLPQGDALVDEVKALKAANHLPQDLVLTLRHWGDKADKRRVHEAAWIGHRMTRAGVRHAHAHFAGIAVRTCWWLREFHRISYSFTGHANDILCPDPFAITRAMLVRDAATVITVSDFTAAYLRRTYGGGRKIKRVYNGLDLQPILAAEGTAPKSSPPLILGVGRLTEKKGFADLVAACGLLRDTGTPFSCEIIGEGELERPLREQIHALALHEHVHLAGPQPMDTIIHRLQQATIFALPCVTERDGGMDNLPTVIMEAMAAALPCVSTRLAGVPEMVVQEETGLLVGERQPTDFAAALKQLLDDPARAQAMGRAGRERARALFDQRHTAKALRRALFSRGKWNFQWAWLADDPLLPFTKLLR